MDAQTRDSLESELFGPESGKPPPPPAVAGPAMESDKRAALEQELFGTPDSGGGLSAAQLASGKDAYGHPFQSIGPIPPGDVVGQSTGKPIAGDNLPGPAIQAIDSLPTDPEQRRRVAAAQLFPGEPPLQAQSHVFYGPDNRLAAVGPDGNAFYVDPQSPSVGKLQGLSPANLLAYAASKVGPALPAAGGFAGGIAGGPASLVAGPIAAGVGAGAGDLARQGLARYFDPQADLSHYNPAQTGFEVAGAAGGQFIGGVFVRGWSPNRLGATPLDVSRLRAGQVLPEAERAYQTGIQQGVTLSPGQASGLPSLLGHEDVINSGSAGPGLSDVAKAFYQRQGNQLATAGQDMLGRISPAADKTDAAMQFQQGAEDATRVTRQNANAAARPAYDAAQRGGTVMSPDLAQLAETPAMQAALAQARVQYQNLYRRAAPDSPDFALWDLAKRHLDDAQGIARRAGENTSAASIDSIRGDLVQHLDAAYPTYADARSIAAPGQRLAARLEGSVGSAVGDGTEKARAIVAPVFEGNNPRAISEARDAFTAAGRGDEWNAGVRSYIQDAFDKASQSQAGLNPAMLRRQIWGNVDNRESIRAALDPVAYQGFDNFMQTVERAARTYPMNSLTAPRMEAKNALLSAAGDTVGVHAAQAAGVALNPFKIVQSGGIIPDKIASYLTGRNLQNISQRLFSPEGMDYLRAMGGLSPGSQRAITATAEFLGQLGVRAAVKDSNAGSNRLIASPAR